MSQIIELVDAQGRVERIPVGNKLASGGAGAVYLVSGDTSRVVKIYHAQTLQKEGHKYEHKIEAMLRQPPALPHLDHNGVRYVQISWPLAIARDAATHNFLGFSMPALDVSKTMEIQWVLTDALAAKKGLRSDLAIRITLARNMSGVLSALHAAGHYVVDLKPVNTRFYKDTHFMAFLDCDGFSIADGNNRINAPQFTADYLAPEFQSTLRPNDNPEQQDRFALAVVLFQLLNNNLHPYSGVPQDSSVPTDIKGSIQGNFYPYGQKPHPKVAPSPASTHECWPAKLRDMFDRAFSLQPSDRPSAKEWAQAFTDYADIRKKLLQQCSNDPKHIHFAGMPCALCGRNKVARKLAQSTTPASSYTQIPSNSPYTPTVPPNSPNTAPSTTGQQPTLSPVQLAATHKNKITVALELIAALILLKMIFWPIVTPTYAVTSFSEPIWQSFMLIAFIVLTMVGPLGAVAAAANASSIFWGGFIGSLANSVQKVGRVTAQGVTNAAATGAALVILIPIAILLAGPVGLYITAVKPILVRMDGSTDTLCCIYGHGRIFATLSPSGKWAYIPGSKLGRFWSDDKPGVYWVDIENGGLVQWKQSGSLLANPLWVYPSSKYANDSIDAVEGPQGNSFTVYISSPDGGEAEVINFSKLGFKDFSAEWSAPALTEQWFLTSYTGDDRLVGQNHVTHQEFDFKVKEGGKTVFLVKTTGIAAVIRPLPSSILGNWTESTMIDFWDVSSGKLITSRRISYMPKDESEYSDIIRHSHDGRVWVINYEASGRGNFWGEEGWVKIIRLDDYFKDDKSLATSSVPTPVEEHSSETQNSEQTTFVPHPQELQEASRIAVDIYQSTGMAGLTAEVGNCYKTDGQNKLNCIYLDLASRRIDQLFVESTGLPANEFFMDENFGSRIAPVLKNENMSMEQANYLLREITPSINKYVEQRFNPTAAEKPKSPGGWNPATGTDSVQNQVNSAQPLRPDSSVHSAGDVIAGKSNDVDSDARVRNLDDFMLGDFVPANIIEATEAKDIPQLLAHSNFHINQTYSGPGSRNNASNYYYRVLRLDSSNTEANNHKQFAAILQRATGCYNNPICLRKAYNEAILLVPDSKYIPLALELCQKTEKKHGWCSGPPSWESLDSVDLSQVGLNPDSQKNQARPTEPVIANQAEQKAAEDPGGKSINDDVSITRIVAAARACMPRRDYDCVISYSEQALGLDPSNQDALRFKKFAEDMKSKGF